MLSMFDRETSYLQPGQSLWYDETDTIRSFISSSFVHVDNGSETEIADVTIDRTKTRMKYADRVNAQFVTQIYIKCEKI